MNLAQRVNLKMLKSRLASTAKKIADIQSGCRHIVVDRNGTAYCEDCETHFGWWCPDSPDHLCQYFSFDKDGARAVKLKDGTEHIFQEYEGDWKYENDDDCLFCGSPDERK